LTVQETAFLTVTPCYPFYFSIPGRTPAFQCQENHQNQDLLAFVFDAVEDDHQAKNMHLYKMNVASIDTIFTTVHKALGLTQKSA
jgi:hypothetical protein